MTIEMENEAKTSTAIILSAGKGTRLGSEIPKQYIEIGHKPVLYYSLKAFEDSNVDNIIIVAGNNDIDFVRKNIVDAYDLKKVKNIVAGGAERYESVRNGIRSIEEREGKVLIHDGARPFISTEKINEMIDLLDENPAVIAGMPVKDTIKIISPNLDIISTTDRSRTWLVQTPQAFELRKIRDAYEFIPNNENIRSKITDDSFVFECMYPAFPIKLFKAGYENIKITTPEDLDYASWLVEKKFESVK